jgi:hypothetical protein
VRELWERRTQGKENILGTVEVIQVAGFMFLRMATIGPIMFHTQRMEKMLQPNLVDGLQEKLLLHAHAGEAI